MLKSAQVASVTSRPRPLPSPGSSAVALLPCDRWVSSAEDDYDNLKCMHHSSLVGGQNIFKTFLFFLLSCFNQVANQVICICLVSLFAWVRYGHHPEVCACKIVTAFKASCCGCFGMALRGESGEEHCRDAPRRGPAPPHRPAPRPRSLRMPSIPPDARIMWHRVFWVFAAGLAPDIPRSVCLAPATSARAMLLLARAGLDCFVIVVDAARCKRGVCVFSPVPGTLEQTNARVGVPSNTGQGATHKPLPPQQCTKQIALLLMQSCYKWRGRYMPHIS